MATHRERRGTGHAPALVADEDRRVIGARRVDDEDRLLEPRIEAGQERDPGAVLAVRPDDDAVVAALPEPGAQRLDPLRVAQGR
jgi:hypothetical protein